MADKTGIEWTDATWNPIRGCSRVSEGCRHCYAESVANRFCGPGQPYEGLVQIDPATGKGNGKWSGQIAFVEDALLQPLRWKRPRRIFVNSMSDLFHEGVTDEMLDRIFAVMALCPQHTFQVLTKRPERMVDYFTKSFGTDDAEDRGADFAAWCLGTLGEEAFHRQLEAKWWMGAPNVWLGVSVENQKAANERIPLLLETPAAVRFLSVEPMLGSVDLNAVIEPGFDDVFNALIGIENCAGSAQIHWVICGGESGPGARPMHPDWARSLRDQCNAAGVPFFFKQWGEWLQKSASVGGGGCLFVCVVRVDDLAIAGDPLLAPKEVLGLFEHRLPELQQRLEAKRAERLEAQRKRDEKALRRVGR